MHLFGHFDPSGAVSLPADAITCAALGCHAISTATAIVVRDTAGADEIHPLAAELIDDQARCLLEDMPVQAIKIGGLHSVDAASVVAQIAADYMNVPLILQLEAIPDESLLQDTDPEDLQGAILELLAPLAHLVIAEHTLLQQWYDQGVLRGESDEDTPAEALLNHNPRWLLVNNMPLRPGQAGHVLYGQEGETVSWPHAPVTARLWDANGPLGCAIMAQLAKGEDMRQAVENAIPIATALAARHFQPGMGNRLIDRTTR